MPLTPEQRRYVVRSVLRILKDVNRDEIIAALKEDIIATEQEDDEEQLELDMVVLAVAQACREKLRMKSLERTPSEEDPSDKKKED
jgi:hypothetical protein